MLWTGSGVGAKFWMALWEGVIVGTPERYHTRSYVDVIKHVPNEWLGHLSLLICTRLQSHLLQITIVGICRFSNLIKKWEVDIIFSHEHHHSKLTALLIFLGDTMFSSGQHPEIVIKAYQDFLSANEQDSPNVPEAYYSIGHQYLKLRNEKKAEEFLKKALQSESQTVRLPCFGPVDDNLAPKFYLTKRKMLANIQLPGFEWLQQPTEACQATPTTEACQATTTTDVCQNCGKADGVLLQCSKCKEVKYCDRICQKKNWKDHKKNCS